jgi:hypothetical protein
MKRNHILLILVLSVSLLLASGCGGTSSPAGTTKATSAPTASVTQGTTASGKQLMVTMPEGWDKVVGSTSLYQYMKGTQSFIGQIEPFMAKTLDGVVDEATAIYAKSFSGYQLVKGPDSITVGGLDARSLQITCKIAGLDMKYRYVYVFVGDDLYALTFGDLASTFDNLAADQQSVLDSVEVK